MKTLPLFLIYFSSICLGNEILISDPGSLINLPNKNGQLIKISQSKVGRVKTIAGQTVLIAQGLGSTQVQIDKLKMELLVVPTEQVKPLTALKDKVQMIPNLKLSTENGRLIVSGAMVTTSEWSSLAHAGAEYWEFRALQSENEKRLMSYLLNHTIRAQGSSPVALDLNNKPTAIVDEHFHTQFPNIFQMLNHYGFKIQINKNIIQPKPNIRLRMWLTEIKKNSLKRIGLTLPNTFTEAGASPDALIQALQENGEGKVLANPTILSRSGETADFFAGGEIPIRTRRNHNQDVLWKKYGISLKAKSSVDDFGRIRIELSASSSSLNASNSVEGIPAIFETQVSSNFDLQKEKSIMISGLVNSISSHSSEGLAYFKDLPILGKLFSSHDYLENLSEMVIFVKPEVVYE